MGQPNNKGYEIKKTAKSQHHAQLKQVISFISSKDPGRKRTDYQTVSLYTVFQNFQDLCGEPCVYVSHGVGHVVGLRGQARSDHAWMSHGMSNSVWLCKKRVLLHDCYVAPLLEPNAE